MNKLGSIKDRIVISGIILFILIANLLYWGIQKEGFYCDELYSYHFVCQVEYPSVNGTREGESWLNSWYNSEYFMDYLTISKAEAFDISGTWKSIREDVHPPVFYLLLELICSVGAYVLPGIFTKWFGIFLNIAFFVLTVGILFVLARRMTGSYLWSLAACVIYGLSVGAVSTVVFIRMYMIFTFTCVFFIYLNVLLWEGLWENRRKFGAVIWCMLIFTTIMGILNHYYFLIFAFFVCVIIWGYALSQKRFNFAFKYAVSMAAGILGSYLIWPEIIRDIFLDYRGTEAFSNLTVNSGFIYALKEFFGIINSELFGGLGNIILLLLLLGMAWRIFEMRWRIKKKTGRHGIEFVMEHKETIKRMEFHVSTHDMFFLQMLSVTLLYVFLVSKIAPYRLDRYIFNIFPMCILLFVYITKRVISGLDSKRIWIGLLAAFMCLSVLISYASPGVNYLFQGTEEELNTVGDYSMRPAFYITESNSRYRVCGDSLYLSKGQYVYPSKEAGIENFMEALDILKKEGGAEYSEYLVYIDLNFQDTESILEKVKKELNVNKAQWLFNSEYSAVFSVF